MRAAYLIVTVYVVATVIVGLVLGAGMLLTDDSSDYDPVHVERIPVTPERPAELNATGATDYSIEYEQTRLYNDIISRHNHTLGTDESVISRCNATAVSETDAGQFRVRLQCVGGVANTNQPSESADFAYTVAYRITENETAQVDIRNYPFDRRGTLEIARS